MKGKKDMTRLSVSLAEAEQITGVSRWTLRRQIKKNKIRATRIGSLIRIPISEIERITASELNSAAALPGKE